MAEERISKCVKHFPGRQRTNPLLPLHVFTIEAHPLTWETACLHFLTADICTFPRKVKGISLLPCLKQCRNNGDDRELKLISFVSYAADNGGMRRVLKARQKR